MSARLTSSIFLNSRPLLALGEHKECQDLSERFLVFLGGKPHQKFLNIWSNFLHNLLGIRKVLIAYEGITVATALMRTDLPA